MAYAYQEALPLVPANYAGAPNQAGFSGWVGPGRAGHVLCWFLHWAWETRAAWGGEMRIVFPVSASSGEDRPAAYGWRRTRRAVTKRHCPLRQSSRGTGNIPPRVGLVRPSVFVVRVRRCSYPYGPPLYGILPQISP